MNLINSHKELNESLYIENKNYLINLFLKSGEVYALRLLYRLIKCNRSTQDFYEL